MADTSRRSFIKAAGLGVASFGIGGIANAAEKKIQGFDDKGKKTKTAEKWEPVSDRKIRVGIAGHGFCKFGQSFGFQDHPNVEVVAVTDLFPDRCAAMAKACRCKKPYPSFEEMVKNDSIEAVFIATDAPSHARLSILALGLGKHVCTAVPATFGSLEDGEKLFEAYKKAAGPKYMMMETSAYHNDLYAMRELYRAGRFGKMIYSEGEYYHYCPQPLESYKGWRIGPPPQLYPTHSNAYYNAVTGGSFTEVSCMGIPSIVPHLMAKNNVYKNPFGTEIALFRTSEGGMSRMAVSWDTPGDHGEKGRVRGQKGSYYGQPQALDTKGVNVNKPPLPPGMAAGHHGGSSGYLTNEFITSILEDRKPLVDIAMALNMTVSGIVAHQSAMKDGELLKIPQYKYPG
ncbi:MAG: Gfo/Idh/MocA family oxidoreductase [Pirellulales bacterium]|nr:Gfo/Idh/MocA family oxidoreductase [Pirellulales bacterium]